MILLQFLGFVAGAALVVTTVRSAIHTFVLPRSANVWLTSSVFRLMRAAFNLRLRKVQTYEQRDSVMAMYAPLSVLALLPVWLMLVGVGYSFMFWALGPGDWQRDLSISVSALLTLGYATADGFVETLLMFSEATIGLMLVALLIGYLPTIYTAFSRREAAVAMLEVRAGSPPNVVDMIERYQRLHSLAGLRDVWVSWENWFTDVEESHTSLPMLVFFRSPQPDRSWVTAAGAVLDTASLVNAALDVPHDTQADLCIRAGYIALRRIGNVDTAERYRVSAMQIARAHAFHEIVFRAEAMEGSSSSRRMEGTVRPLATVILSDCGAGLCGRGNTGKEASIETAVVFSGLGSGGTGAFSGTIVWEITGTTLRRTVRVLVEILRRLT